MKCSKTWKPEQITSSGLLRTRSSQPYLINLIGLGAVIFGVTACGGTAKADPTQVSAILTSVALSATLPATPEPDTPTPTPSPSLTETPSPTQTQTPSPEAAQAAQAAQAPAQSSSSACDSAVYVADVTIPDGTRLDPGDDFTKTWKIMNSGTCDWSTDYSVVFVSGDSMDGETTSLDDSVSAGDSVEISVDMEAPSSGGQYVGYWQMENASGETFGNTFYVAISVDGKNATATRTPTDDDDDDDDDDATSTRTRTPTRTPTDSAYPYP